MGVRMRLKFIMNYRIQKLLLNLWVYDVLGLRLLQKNIAENKGSLVPAENLENGVYFIQLFIDNYTSRPLYIVKH